MNLKKFVRRTARALVMGCVMAMMLIFFTVTLPTNPSADAATVGKDYLVYVNTGTPTVPVWTLIGGQRGSSLNRGVAEIDTSHKTSGGWETSKVGLKNWSIDLDGLVLLNDLGIEALDTAYMTGVEINIKFEYPDATYRTGWANVIDFNHETPHDGEASLSGSLKGTGALSALTPAVSVVNTVTPEADTFSKGSPADLEFEVSSTGTVDLVGLKIGVSTTVNTANYTYENDTLTIEGDYLGNLANGDKVFTLLMSAGNDLVVSVTVGA